MSEYSDAAVEAIQKSTETKTIEVRGEEYTTRQVFLPPVPKEPDYYNPLKLTNLDSIISYVNEVDHLDKAGLIVIVHDPETVYVMMQNPDGKMEGTRRIWAHADADLPAFSYGYWLPTDEMIIQLNSRFVVGANDDHEKLVQILGNVVAQEAITQKDDGMTQQVVVQSGIQRSAVELPVPCRLTPFRSFVEVEQTTSEYLVRTKKSGDSVSVAIFEADGGAWKIEARRRVKSYLTEHIEGVTILA